MDDTTGPETVKLGPVRVPILPSLVSPMIEKGLRKGWYEFEERRAIASAVRKGDRVLDLGGGIGVCAATAALAAQDIRLTIVEANPALHDAIRLTMTLNGIADYELLSGAVSLTTARTTRLELGEHYWAAREVDGPSDNSVEVPILPPGPLLARVRPDVLICDIEGNERGLIETCDLSSVRCFIVELHPNIYGRGTSEALDAKLLRDGFRRVTKWAAPGSPQVQHYHRDAG